jgi:hypothetical protein
MAILKQISENEDAMESDRNESVERRDHGIGPVGCVRAGQFLINGMYANC